MEKARMMIQFANNICDKYLTIESGGRKNPAKADYYQSFFCQSKLT
jgi:hypothetical protein